MLTRRSFVQAGSAAVAGAAAVTLSGPAAAAPPTAFVQRSGTRLMLGGKPYRFVGANMWYGAWLGAKASFGDRDRLARELDQLANIGVTNLRVAAGTETSPLKNAVSPAFRTAGKTWNPALIDGLDHLLSEMAKRDMKAVLYLTNFWEWSGGMMTYLSYVNGGTFINMNDPAHPWPEFPDMTAQFYANSEAVGLFHDYVRSIVQRHAGNPTIMAWQLANEPRPGGSEKVATPLLPAFYGWIASTAKLIKSLDRNHLLSTGSEGLKGTLERADIFRAAHSAPEIDYLTAHIWPLNWNWLDDKDVAGTHHAASLKVADYLAQHAALAREMGKPLTIEEFGYPRDDGRYSPTTATIYKVLYYKQIFDAVEHSARNGGPIAGSNFWAWNGEGRAAHADHRFRDGDTAWLGDPPHEPQGWYGVYNSDRSTTELIKHHAAMLASIG